MSQQIQESLPESGPKSQTGPIRRARRRLAAVSCLLLVGFLALGGAWWMLASARFDEERVRTEAETIHNAMAGMLAMGLPVSDFIGFHAASDRVLRFDPTVRAVEIADQAGRVVLRNPETFEASTLGWYDGAGPRADPAAADIRHQGWQSRFSLPVTGRFGPSGSVVVYFEHEIVAEFGRSTAIAGLAAMVLLAIGIAVHATVLANPEVFRSYREMATLYGVTCVIGLGVVGATIFGLGAAKAVETANAYGESLGSRIGDAMALGIDPIDLVGLDEVIREYRESNDIISYVALLEGNRIVAAAGLEDATDRWLRPDGEFDAVIEVRPRRLYRPQYRVAVGIPLAPVAGILWRSGSVAMLGALALTVIGFALLAWIRVPAPSASLPEAAHATA